ALRRGIYPAARGVGRRVSPLALARRLQSRSVPQRSRLFAARSRQRRREAGGRDIGGPGRASPHHRRVPARRGLWGGMGFRRQVRLGRRPRHPAGFLTLAPARAGSARNVNAKRTETGATSLLPRLGCGLRRRRRTRRRSIAERDVQDRDLLLLLDDDPLGESPQTLVLAVA